VFVGVSWKFVCVLFFLVGGGGGGGCGLLISYARHIVVESQTNHFIGKYLTSCKDL